MESPTLKENFLKDDLYNCLKELFIGAVAWHAADTVQKETPYLLDLGMFTCFVQARALYEFFYVKRKSSPAPGSTASASHFASSEWSPLDRHELYRRYMGKDAPAQKRVFHLVYGRKQFSGGRVEDGSEDLKYRVLDFATDLKRLTKEFAERVEDDKYRELIEGALARALEDGHELAKKYGVPDPL